MSRTVDTTEIVQAIQTAIDFAKALLSSENARDFRFEEYQESPDKNSWLITIGFLRPDKIQPLKYFSGVETHFRAYKVVEISKETGLPIAMRNREGD